MRLRHLGDRWVSLCAQVEATQFHMPMHTLAAHGESFLENSGIRARSTAAHFEAAQVEQLWNLIHKWNADGPTHLNPGGLLTTCPAPSTSTEPSAGNSLDTEASPVPQQGTLEQDQGPAPEEGETTETADWDVAKSP